MSPEEKRRLADRLRKREERARARAAAAPAAVPLTVVPPPAAAPVAPSPAPTAPAPAAGADPAKLQEALRYTFGAAADGYHLGFLNADDPRLQRRVTDELARVWAPVLAPYIDEDTAKLLPLAVAVGMTATELRDYHDSVQAHRRRSQLDLDLARRERPPTGGTSAPPNTPLGNTAQETPRG